MVNEGDLGQLDQAALIVDIVASLIVDTYQRVQIKSLGWYHIEPASD